MRHPALTLATAVATALALTGSASAGSPGTGSAKAPPTIGSNIRVSGPYATGEEYAPAIAWSDTNDRYLVVWRDTRPGALGDSDIFGRVVGADGTFVGGDFRISGPQATANEFDPAVAWNATTKEWLVVWEDERKAQTRGPDIYGRRVNMNGRPLGNDFRISGAGATSGEFQPAVACNQTTGQYLVAWVDGRKYGSRGMDIYARLIKADGSPGGSDRRISGSAATADERSPDVAWSPSANSYLVVWDDARLEPSRGIDVYAQKVNRYGQRVGTNRRVSGPAALVDDYAPAVAWNQAAAEYLVVWADDRNKPDRGSDIFGRRVGPGGRLRAGDFRICGNGATSFDYQAAVSVDQGSGEYLVAWQDGRMFGSRKMDTYGRKFDSDAAPVAGDFRISGSQAVLDELDVALAWSQTSDRFFVVWQDYRINPVGGSAIYGRHISG